MTIKFRFPERNMRHELFLWVAGAHQIMVVYGSIAP